MFQLLKIKHFHINVLGILVFQMMARFIHSIILDPVPKSNRFTILQHRNKKHDYKQARYSTICIFLVDYIFFKLIVRLTPYHTGHLCWMGFLRFPVKCSVYSGQLMHGWVFSHGRVTLGMMPALIRGSETGTKRQNMLFKTTDPPQLKECVLFGDVMSTVTAGLTPTFLNNSPTMLRADIRADVVRGVPVRPSTRHDRNNSN